MLCAVILLFIIYHSRVAAKVEAYIYAIITWTFFMFCLTEVLSIFKALSTGPLWVCWGILDAVLFAVCLKGHMFKLKKVSVSVLWKKTGIRDLLPIGACVWGGVLLLALKTVPYNWDSMAYHLGRIVHWYQNQSVAHYATNIVRQLACPILGNFAAFHVYAMSHGSDRFLNLVQCFSYLTNGCLVYWIARKLKCGTKYCILAWLLFLSAPIAFAEALSTQVDHYPTLFTLCFVYLLLDFIQIGKKLSWDGPSVMKVVMMGLCIAFGYSAKPYVGFAVLCFGLWLLVISIIRRDSILVILKLILVTLPGMVFVLVPEFLRNLKTFHALSAPLVSAKQLIGSWNERYLIVNFFKNFAFNMPTVWIYDSSSFAWKCVVRLAGWLDVDIDSLYISDGLTFSIPSAQQYSHDSAVNPLILWLLIATIVLVLCMIRKWNIKKLSGVKAGYYISAVASFIALCTVLRWEPFVSRFMILFFALLCPALASTVEWIMGNIKEREKVELGTFCIIGFCVFTEMAGLFCYHGRIAFDNHRAEGYFVIRPNIYGAYEGVADYIEKNNIMKVGLLVEEGTYEYPLWKMISHYRRIEHVNVGNDSAIYEDYRFIPEVILVIDRSIDGNFIECHGHKYAFDKEFGDYIYTYKIV